MGEDYYRALDTSLEYQIWSLGVYFKWGLYNNVGLFINSHLVEHVLDWSTEDPQGDLEDH